MIVEIEKRPRIAVDVYVKVEGVWFDLAELREVFLILDLGDIAVEDGIPLDLSNALSAIGVMTTYNRSDVPTASTGPNYAEFRQKVAEACVREQLPPIE